MPSFASETCLKLGSPSQIFCQTAMALWSFLGDTVMCSTSNVDTAIKLLRVVSSRSASYAATVIIERIGWFDEVDT